MPKALDVGLDFQTLTQLRDQYRGYLPLHTPRHLRRQKGTLQQRTLIVIGGIPGSGKSTAAREIASLLNILCVQSNSARYVLSQHDLGYGSNVPALMRLVLKSLMAERYDIVLDGMLLGQAKRKMLAELADDYHYQLVFAAVFCNPAQSQAWADKRYEDGEMSSFWNWRAKPENFPGYKESMSTINQTLLDEAGEIGGLGLIENFGSIRSLRRSARSVFEKMKCSR